jgi:hypothetical protein
MSTYDMHGCTLLPADITNFEVYTTTIEDLINKFMADKQCSAVAMVYGPSGSGKTHTMFGSSSCIDKIENGIIYYALCALFSRGDAPASFMCSYYELYGKKIHHLLKEKNIKVCSLEEAKSCLLCQKKTAKTDKNPNSSRSHSFFVLRDEKRTLTFCDLAGSEGASDNTETDKKSRLERSREATDIKYGLLRASMAVNFMPQGGLLGGGSVETTLKCKHLVTICCVIPSCERDTRRTIAFGGFLANRERCLKPETSQYSQRILFPPRRKDAKEIKHAKATGESARVVPKIKAENAKIPLLYRNSKPATICACRSYSTKQHDADRFKNQHTGWPSRFLRNNKNPQPKHSLIDNTCQPIEILKDETKTLSTIVRGVPENKPPACGHHKNTEAIINTLKELTVLFGIFFLSL